MTPPYRYGVPTIWTVGYEKLLPPALVAELERPASGA